MVIESGNLTFAIGRTNRLPGGWFQPAWLLLLIGEVIALSLSFDVNIPAVANQPSLIVRWVAGSSLLIRLGICLGTIAAMVLFCSAPSRRELAELYRLSSPGRRSWARIAAHILAYAVFFWSTGRLISGMSRSSDQTLPVLFWLGCGVATLVTWLLAAMPIEFWLCLVRQGWNVLLAGIVLGLVALHFGQSTGRLWHAFHGWTFHTASIVLGMMSDCVVSRPESFDLGTRDFTVNIAPVCSGFEGIGLIWAFLGGYLVLHRQHLRFPQALWLLPIGTVVIWFLNVLRIVGLVMVGTWGHSKVALGGFHSQVGWLAFNLVGLGLVAISRQVEFFSRRRPAEESRSVESTNPTTVYLAPLLCVVAVAMITGAMSDGVFDRLYGVRVVAAIGSLWLGRRAWNGWKWTWSYSAVAIGTLVFLLWMILEPTVDGASPSARAIPRALQAMPPWAAAFWLTMRLVGAVITVPLVEELAFRGYLVRRLIAADFETVPFTRFTWPSFLFSSLVFGAMHQRFLAGSIAGLLYALAVQRRGRLGDGVLAHATTNALIAAFVLATGKWSLWS
ncbi:MAG: exosortase E/protease, VPEID-CTERM system [Isosphaeraceae bacterium]